MTPARLTVLPSFQRIKFLTCTSRSACASAALCPHHPGCGLFKAPPQRLAPPMGRRSSSWGRGHDSGLANGRAESFLYLSEGRVPGVPGWNRRGTAL